MLSNQRVEKCPLLWKINYKYKIKDIVYCFHNLLFISFKVPAGNEISEHCTPQLFDVKHPLNIRDPVFVHSSLNWTGGSSFFGKSELFKKALSSLAVCVWLLERGASAWQLSEVCQVSALGSELHTKRPKDFNEKRVHSSRAANAYLYLKFRVLDKFSENDVFSILVVCRKAVEIVEESFFKRFSDEVCLLLINF